MLTIDKLILDNNKLIAEFMGYRVFHKRYPRNHGIGAGMNQPKDVILEKCRYNHDWNWLIPVIEKIESLGYYVSIMKSNVTCCKDGGISPIFAKYDYKNKLETTWLAVTEFIKFYNKENGKSTNN